MTGEVALRQLAAGTTRDPEDGSGDGGRLLWGVAVGTCAVTFLAATGVVALNVDLARTAPAYADGRWDLVSSVLLYLLLVALAITVVRRRRTHPVGWLLLLLGLLEGTEALTAQLALVGLHVPGHDATTAAGWAVLSESLQRPEMGVALAVLAVFPTGRVPTRRWRPLSWALVIVFGAWFVDHLLRPEPLEEAPFRGLANPLGRSWLGGSALHFLFLPAAGLLAVVVVASMVVRFRHSSGVERQQLRWIGFLALGVPLGLVAIGVAELCSPGAMNIAGNAVWVFMDVGLPVAVVIAITRHRLYDLDLLVNRTVVYGALSAVLVATYVLVVLVVSRVVVHTGWVSPWVVGTATVAAAVVAAPARRTIQDHVDRLFGRRAWDATRQVQEFSARWHEQPQRSEAVREMLAEVLRDPDLQLGFWLRRPGAYVGTDGRPLPLPGPESGRSATFLDMHGEPVAVVVHTAELDRDPRLLRAVARASGLVTENARLHAELLEQLAEVEASRARIVEAADSERRRVERDLHDGAQQRLVALAMRLRLAARRAGSGAEAAAMHEAVAELGEATRELRELSRGIHPAALDHGLDAALEALGARSPVPLVLDVPVHLPGQVELTTYYLACEAVTNAVKHARATRIEVHVRIDAGQVVMTVRDNGRGGADARRGSGLTGLQDRAAAAGGRVLVESRLGAGTTITARLPCGC